VDGYAVRSQELAAKAWAGGYFANSVIPVADQNGLTLLDHDEHMRPESTVESLGKLARSFAGVGDAGGFDAVALQKYHWVEKIDHVHHAGNSSGIVDGAALVLVGSENAGKQFGLTPRARVVATATSGADSTIMLTGPTPATEKLLAGTGLTVDDIDLFEINEAFASVVLRYQKDLRIPDEKLNVNGGAIAMGHPLGATGAMILGTMVDELERREAPSACARSINSPASCTSNPPEAGWSCSPSFDAVVSSSVTVIPPGRKPTLPACRITAPHTKIRTFPEFSETP